MGHPGLQGPKGDQGMKGFSGAKGHPGVPGYPGETVSINGIAIYPILREIAKHCMYFLMTIRRL